jgi:copper chaperone CopZ
MPEITLKVKGMNCNHCKTTVETNLGRIEGITSVNADITNNTVHITGDNIHLPALESKLTDLGYVYQGTE